MPDMILLVFFICVCMDICVYVCVSVKPPQELAEYSRKSAFLQGGQGDQGKRQISQPTLVGGRFNKQENLLVLRLSLDGHKTSGFLYLPLES